ncbi:conserved hypothetical protein [delta proteobacterium NaphS2]|nr:conserved hypothetical protein [delta proteobacterium NaphS2]
MAELNIPLIQKAEKHIGRAAMVTASGSFKYDQLLEASSRVASRLLSDQRDLKGRRVAFLTRRDFDYPAVQWGIWRAGGIAVPLCEVHPPAELHHTISDCEASMVIGHSDFAEVLSPVAEKNRIPFLLSEHLFAACNRTLPRVDPERPALMLYTSGTTGKPKMVSGSAALPTTAFQEWKTITGHKLLERYGMTEIGMALSNPLRGRRQLSHPGKAEHRYYQVRWL